MKLLRIALSFSLLITLIATVLAHQVHSEMLQCHILREYPILVGHFDAYIEPRRVELSVTATVVLGCFSTVVTLPFDDLDARTPPCRMRYAETEDVSLVRTTGGEVVGDQVYEMYLGGASPHYSRWFFHNCEVK